MAQRTQLDDVNNLLHDAYACQPASLLANGLDGAGEALRTLGNVVQPGYERLTSRIDSLKFLRGWILVTLKKP